MKKKFAIAHMQVAQIYATLSQCKRLQVGCVIVKDDSIISIGYNGTPSGEDNTCEYGNNTTKPTVVHAEDNALRKLTRRSDSAVGSVLFVTTVPCELCAARVVDAGVVKVYYSERYRCTKGMEYLTSHGVELEQLQIT